MTISIEGNEAYIERGNKCSLWGVSVPDMGREELILFIGFLDEVAIVRQLALQELTRRKNE